MLTDELINWLEQGKARSAKEVTIFYDGAQGQYFREFVFPGKTSTDVIRAHAKGTVVHYYTQSV